MGPHHLRTQLIVQLWPISFMAAIPNLRLTFRAAVGLVLRNTQGIDHFPKLVRVAWLEEGRVDSSIANSPHHSTS